MLLCFVSYFVSFKRDDFQEGSPSALVLPYIEIIVEPFMNDTPF